MKFLVLVQQFLPMVAHQLYLQFHSIQRKVDLTLLFYWCNKHCVIFFPYLMIIRFKCIGFNYSRYRPKWCYSGNWPKNSTEYTSNVYRDSFSRSNNFHNSYHSFQEEKVIVQSERFMRRYALAFGQSVFFGNCH